MDTDDKRFPSAEEFTAPEGMIFSAYYSESDGKTYQPGDKYELSGHQTVKVLWVPVSTVKFDTQGHGTAPMDQTVVTGEKAIKPYDPVETGYTFEGWFKEPSCTTEWNFETDAVTENMTLYAKWTPWQLIITFNANDGTEVRSWQVIKYDDASKTLSPNTFVRNGYSFDVWKITGGTDIYADKADVGALITSPESTLSLDAQWMEWQLTVTFNANGGTGTMDQQKIKYTDASKTLDPNRFKWSQHTFSQWKVTDGDDVYKDAADISALITSIDATLSLDAQWTIDEIAFTVNNKNYGSVSPISLKDVPVGVIVEFNGDKLTVNGTVVTASAKDPTAQYTFKFDKWLGIPADHILVEPITITADFT